MSKLPEVVSLHVTEEMKERADEADRGQAEYIRQKWLAGESAVADLDPRVGDSGKANREINTAEAAAQALDDGVLISELSDEKQEFEKVVQTITQEFENVLANRLQELANDEQSSVETDGRGNYYLER
jgi:membrane-associated HD superfamily phosphohydrolase